MGSLSLLVVAIGLVIYYCNAQRTQALAFSGGGIRAAVGTYYAMRRFEDTNTLDTIDSISLISGGSWGFIMWLYEDEPNAVVENIYDYIYEHGNWGTKGPIETKTLTKKSWYEKWEKEIQTNIIDMTSLKGTGKSLPKFGPDFRQRLNEKKLQDVQVYFVVETTSPKTRKLRDDKVRNYCWFKSSHDKGEEFQCLHYIHNYDIQETRIVRKVDTMVSGKKEKVNIYDPVYLLDVLNYCSSAWATPGGKAKLTRVLTKEFRGYHTEDFDSKDFITYHLMDAGDSFNDPLIPYMVNDYYSLRSHGAGDVKQIMNFDFSQPTDEEKSTQQNLFEISKLPRILDLLFPDKYDVYPPMQCKSNEKGEYIDIESFFKEKVSGLKKIKRKIVETPIRENIKEQSSYQCMILYREIFHIPLWGEHSKDKFIDFFPTMKSWHRSMIVYNWDMMRFMFFEKDWNGHLKTIIQPSASVDDPYTKKKDRTDELLRSAEPMHSAALPQLIKASDPTGELDTYRDLTIPITKKKKPSPPQKKLPKSPDGKIHSKKKRKKKQQKKRKLLIEQKAFNNGNDYMDGNMQHDEQHNIYYRANNVIYKHIMIILLMIVSFVLVYSFCIHPQNRIKKQNQELNEPQIYLDESQNIRIY